MTRLAWGAHGERFFETGTDRGVLYLTGQPGVPWNGLKAVSESPTGGDPKPYYIDGYKYLNVAAAEEFAATLEAFSSPREFGVCDGTIGIHNGLFATQQPRKQFGLSYRTLVGNDRDGMEHGYKIHIVYNALAAPTQRSNQTNGSGVEPLALSWSITTQPPLFTGIKPTAHFVIDSRVTPKRLMDAIEDILYGSMDEEARLPSVQELNDLFSSEGPLLVTNRFINPSMERTTANVELFRNIAINPIQASVGVGINTNNGAYYVVTRGVTLSSPTPDGITTGAKIVPQAANTTETLASAYNVDGLSNVAPARSLGTWVKVNRAGYSAVLASGPSVRLTANSWTWVKSGPGTGALNSHVSLVITHDTAIQQTDWAEVTGTTAFEGLELPQYAIWPGMPLSDSALVSATWVGSTNQSQTIITGRRVDGASAVSTEWARVWQSAEWRDTGEVSLRIRPWGPSLVNATTTVAASIDIANYAAIGEEVTIMLSVYKPGPAVVYPALYGAVDIYDGGYKFMAQTPNAEGLHLVRFKATRLNSLFRIRLVHGQPHNTAPDLFIDSLAIVEGDYKGPFIYGDMPDVDGKFYSWAGTPNWSESYLHSWY